MTESQGRHRLPETRLGTVLAVWLLALLPVLFAVRSPCQTLTTLYSFNAGGNLSDGGWPEAGVTRDTAGNLYGTTFFGGTGTGCDIYYAGCGTVFKLDPSGAETVLHNFGAPPDGANPTARLILDTAGNLYGATPYGGAYGHGVVFKVDALGNETILHSFAGGKDGARPNAGLVADAAGNLYGMTQYGGTGCNGQGCGTVFEVTTSGQEIVLYKFTGGLDGASPLSGVALDSSGTIYGTTWLGGVYGLGAIFKIDGGIEKVLHAFTGGADGANPIAGPVLDAAGNLYGATSAGGASGGSILGLGTIYKVDTTGAESVLYTFTGGADGAYPYAHLLVDDAGNLYGTAGQGGVSTGSGTVFELSGNPLSVAFSYSFSGGADGSLPVGGLMADSAGNYYGTTTQGGANGWGAVFEIQF